jgi:hypothetical protein
VSPFVVWIGPIIAVASLALSIWNTVKLQKRDHRQQAELVTAWLIPCEEKQNDQCKVFIGLLVKNASNQLVYDVIAQAVAVQGSFRHTAVGEDDQRNREYGVMIGNVPPGEYTTRINYGGGGMHKRFWVEFAFQDAAGNYWLRRGNGTLEQIHKHPVDLYNLSRPISWQN